MRAPVAFDVPELDLKPFFLERDRLTLNYERSLDTLYVRPKSGALPGISAYIADGIYVRYDPETARVVGLQIEAFEKNFIRIYPEIEEAWDDIKQRYRKPSKISQIIDALLAILRQFFENLTDVADDRQLLLPSVT